MLFGYVPKTFLQPHSRYAVLMIGTFARGSDKINDRDLFNGKCRFEGNNTLFKLFLLLFTD